MEINDKTHIRLTIVTFCSGLVFAITIIGGFIAWYGEEQRRQEKIENRLAELERGRTTQWSAISKNRDAIASVEKIGERVSRIDERTITIMRILESD